MANKGLYKIRVVTGIMFEVYEEISQRKYNAVENETQSLTPPHPRNVSSFWACHFLLRCIKCKVFNHIIVVTLLRRHSSVKERVEFMFGCRRGVGAGGVGGSREYWATLSLSRCLPPSAFSDRQTTPAKHIREPGRGTLAGLFWRGQRQP